jgi:multidrug resistance efflux pump
LGEITTEYHTLRQAVQRKKLLAELYAREATALLQTAQRIPSELASQPAIAKAQMESEKARIALQKARLQLFKTVFLWEYLHEDQS